MKKYYKKFVQKILAIKVRGLFSRGYNFISSQSYMRAYIKYLRYCGIKINGTPNFIANDVYFDSHDYSLISIGNDSVISMGVTLLTHDYSIARGIQAVYGKKVWDRKNTPHFLKPISIGNNCFIGAGSILLPDTTIGDNSIIGSHAVVKGKIPPNSIVVGNPGQIIAQTDEWAKRHMELHDYFPK